MTSVKITVFFILDHQNGKAKTPVCVKVSFYHGLKDMESSIVSSTKYLKPLNFKAKDLCWILSALVIKTQFPGTWDVRCVEQEKGTMHQVGDLFQLNVWIPFWKVLLSALSSTEQHMQQLISHGQVTSTDLAEKSELDVQLVLTALCSTCTLT